MDENNTEKKENASHSDVDDVLRVFDKNHEGHVNDDGLEKKTIEIRRVDSDADSDTMSGATRVDMPRVNMTFSEFESVKERAEAEKKDGLSPFVPRDGRRASSQNPPSKPKSGVSLDDFNAENETQHTYHAPIKKQKAKRAPLSRPVGVTVYLLAVLLVSIIIARTVICVGNDVFAFVKDDAEVTVTVPENPTLGDVAHALKEAGVIRYPFVYRLYTSFRTSRRSYLTGKYKSGTFTVNPMMNYDALIDVFNDGNVTKNGVVRITIPEGLTVRETLALLEENGVGKAADFVDALQNFEYDYKFAELLGKDKISEYRYDISVSYRLEGYLFPDTYDFYLEENPVSVINKFLVNFHNKFDETFYDRCDALQMTPDEVITLASLIEKEGNNASDFYMISSVFHNRLSHSGEYPFLNSDATIQYALDARTDAYAVDTSYEHPYNTYIHKGLPPGPICNPGIEAITAALYPEESDYYYFYTKKDGVTVYSRNQAEHDAVVAEDR